MKQYMVLIAGGGMILTRQFVVSESSTPDGSIGMISSETDKPYARRFPKACGKAGHQAHAITEKNVTNVTDLHGQIV